MDHDELKHYAAELEKELSKDGTTLHEIKIQLRRFISHLLSEQRTTQNHSDRLEQHDKALYGDKDNLEKQPGILNDLQTIKEFVAFNRKLHWFVAVSVGGLALKTVWQGLEWLVRNAAKL